MGVRLRRLFIGPFAILAAVALGGLVMPAGPASAASRAVASGATSPNYGPKPCKITITIKPNPSGHGYRIVIKISGSCGHDRIVIIIHSTPMTLGTITTNASGDGSGAFNIPSSLADGAHTVIASDAQGNSDSAHIVLTGMATARAVAVPKVPGPSTGTDAAAVGAVAAGAVGVIGLLVLGIRKRRHHNFT